MHGETVKYIFTCCSKSELQISISVSGQMGKGLG